MKRKVITKMNLNNIILAFIGFSAGITISCGVVAFIVVIGVIPRLVQKTKTQKYIRIYETSITCGGIFGTIASTANIRLDIGIMGAILFGLFGGIFVGCLAVSLAEVLNVIPILMRRLSLKVGMSYFIVALAIGKMIGSLIYFIVPGFVMWK